MKILHIGGEERFRRYMPQMDAQMRSVPAGRPLGEYVQAMPDADVIIVDAMADVPKELIEAMPHLRLIHSEGVGFNRIDLETAGKHGIYVCNCAGMNGQAVAEQTLLLMLGVIRNVANNDQAVRDGRQIQVKEAYMADGSLKDLADHKIGLIGLGHIGQCTAKLLKAFGTNTFYTQRRRALEETEKACGVTWLASQEELLRTCDIISLHLPVTPQTEKMCNSAFFASMKPGSYLINTSRGELVDDEALSEALQSGKIAMAGLDTLDQEPVQKDHVLLNLPEDLANKILFSPHIGGITGSSFRKGYAMIGDNIQRLADGKPLQNVVNAEYLSH